MGWEVRMSNSRKVHYFYDPESGESRWDNPPGFSDAEIAALPGASKYLQQAQPSSEGPAQVRASHLLVKHRGSRRPSSWKEENITRSKEEAIGILQGYAAEINGDFNKFGELAYKHSDCSSHAKNGDLGFFKRGQMQKPFEDATYALEVGQISDIVDTDSGVHLIMRTG